MTCLWYLDSNTILDLDAKADSLELLSVLILLC